MAALEERTILWIFWIFILGVILVSLIGFLKTNLGGDEVYEEEFIKADLFISERAKDIVNGEVKIEIKNEEGEVILNGDS